MYFFNNYFYSHFLGPPPAGFYPSGGAAPYLGQAPYPGAAGAGVGGVYPGATQYTGQGQPTGGGMSYNTYDYNQPGSGGDTFAAFSDKTIRQGFIRYVGKHIISVIFITYCISLQCFQFTFFNTYNHYVVISYNNPKSLHIW